LSADRGVVGRLFGPQLRVVRRRLLCNSCPQVSHQRLRTVSPSPGLNLRLHSSRCHHHSRRPGQVFHAPGGRAHPARVFDGCGAAVGCVSGRMGRKGAGRRGRGRERTFSCLATGPSSSTLTSSSPFSQTRSPLQPPRWTTTCAPSWPALRPPSRPASCRVAERGRRRWGPARPSNSPQLLLLRRHPRPHPCPPRLRRPHQKMRPPFLRPLVVGRACLWHPRPLLLPPLYHCP